MQSEVRENEYVTIDYRGESTRTHPPWVVELSRLHAPFICMTIHEVARRLQNRANGDGGVRQITRFVGSSFVLS